MDLLIANVSNMNINDVPRLPVRKYKSLLDHSYNISVFKITGELKPRNSENESNAISGFIEKKKKDGKIKSLREQGIR